MSISTHVMCDKVFSLYPHCRAYYSEMRSHLAGTLHLSRLSLYCAREQHSIYLFIEQPLVYCNQKLSTGPQRQIKKLALHELLKLADHCTLFVENELNIKPGITIFRLSRKFLFNYSTIILVYHTGFTHQNSLRIPFRLRKFQT